MSTNYLQFSEVITDITSEEKDWILNRLEYPTLEEEEENWPSFVWSFELPSILWIRTDECGEPLHVAKFVQQFLKKFRPQSWWSMTWATYGSRMRAGEFGGGAVFVTAKKVKFMEAGTWNSKQESAFIKKSKSK